MAAQLLLVQTLIIYTALTTGEAVISVENNSSATPTPTAATGTNITPASAGDVTTKITDSPWRDSPTRPGMAPWAVQLSEEVARYVLIGRHDQRRVDDALTKALAFLAAGQLTTSCAGHVRLLVQRIADGVRLQRDADTDWAMQMFDANGGSATGNLGGRTFWLGKYRQCLHMDSSNGTAPAPPFAGKYCIARVTIPAHRTADIPVQLDDFDSTLKIATCLPNSCNTKDVERLLKELHQPMFDNSTIDTSDHLCQTRDDSQVDAIAIVILTILMIPVVLVLIGTIYDVMYLYQSANSRKGSKKSDDSASILDPKKRMAMFLSARKGVLNLFCTPPGDTDVTCIYGLRFLNVVWMITLQVCSYVYREYPWENHGEVFEVKDSFVAPLVTAGSYATDAFLFLSAFCLTHVALETVSRQDPKRKILLFGLARLLRVTPPYAFMVSVFAGPMALAARGPMWSTVVAERDTCRSSWWANLLYINNFAQSYEHQCIKSSWYLALDMQCYLFSLPLIIFMIKKPLIGRNVLLILTMMSSMAVGVLIGQFHTEQYFGGRFTFQNFSEYFTKILVVPWSRIGVFFVGVVVAQYEHQARLDGFKMKSRTYLAGWAVCIVVFLALVYGPLPYTGHARMYRATEVLYGVVSRPLFGAVMGWTVLACATGYGGCVNDFLSAPVWRWLSRLTLCIFLVHEPIIMYYFWTVHNNAHLSMEYLMLVCLGTLVTSTAAAILLYVLIESPIGAMRHLVFAQLVRRPRCRQPSSTGEGEGEADPLNSYQTFAALSTARPQLGDDRTRAAFGIATSTDEEEEFTITDSRAVLERKDLANFMVGP